MLDRASNADQAVIRLRDFIRASGCVEGDRLPADAQLVVQLGLDADQIRRAVGSLEEIGAVERRDETDTVVLAAAVAPPDPADDLGHTFTPMRMMQARFCVEPALAREAAIHASPAALAAFRQPLAAARAATSWEAYEAADDRFHWLVAEACDNALLRMTYEQFNRVRRSIPWGNVERATAQPPADHPSFAEHEAIADAIAAREPDRAWFAMRAHLTSVSKRKFP